MEEEENPKDRGINKTHSEGTGHDEQKRFFIQSKIRSIHCYYKRWPSGMVSAQFPHCLLADHLSVVTFTTLKSVPFQNEPDVEGLDISPNLLPAMTCPSNSRRGDKSSNSVPLACGFIG